MSNIFLALPVLGWNVTIFNLTSTTFNLHWTKLFTVVNKYATFYIIEVKSVQGTVLTLETVPGHTTSIVITGLKPSSKYRVGVFGIDSVGQSYKSLESVTTTKEGRRQETKWVVIAFIRLYKLSRKFVSSSYQIEHSVFMTTYMWQSPKKDISYPQLIQVSPRLNVSHLTLW